MITARNELLHVADCVSESEAEIYLAAPEMLACCRELIALVEGNRQYQYDTALRGAVEQTRRVVEGLKG